MNICASGGRRTITAGKYTYRSLCGRGVSRGDAFKQYAVGVDECLEICSNTPNCKGVHYKITDTSHCKLYDNGSVNKARDFNKESDCPEGFWIGFAPTARK